jgi:hypothetical protein
VHRADFIRHDRLPTPVVHHVNPGSNVVVKARVGVIIREFYGVETEPGLGFEDIVNAIVIAHSA